MLALCAVSKEDQKWLLIFDLEQYAGECCRGQRLQVEVAVEVALHKKPERRDHVEEETVAVEMKGRFRSRSELTERRLLLESVGA